MTRWLSVIGIGDDGLAGLTADARARLEAAELIVGGARHQAMAPGLAAERLTWSDGVAGVLDALRRWRGRPVAVLASGDPMWFGAGATLARAFAPEEMAVLPQPGAFSLAAARMGWPIADVATLTAHAEAPEGVLRHLAPGQRLLVLSRDGATPARIAALLAARGYGASPLSVLEHLGGPAERRLDGTAAAWPHPRGADLNTVAIECRADTGAAALSLVPGLSDDAFEHDGQMTKRETRAVTIAALAPLPGQTLWDVGAGCGSIAIEWLRAVSWARRADGRRADAVAIERDPRRCGVIARNAGTLGTPRLRIVEGAAPDAFDALAPAPDSIFAGGGISQPGLLDACWERLAAGGRLVANAVSLEAAAALIAFRARVGGELTRIAIARSAPIGDLTAFRPLMEVTQLTAVKP